MRPKGKASVSQIYPRAFAVCDRCGSLVNHPDLTWQYQWRGTKLQNIQQLVCESCRDTPQEQLRVIILPMDPVPIMNARPENYVEADNPLSAVGYSPISQTIGSRIGNLLGGGGLNAAFDGNPYKPSWQSASNTLSNSSFSNYVGINWAGANAGALGYPSDLLPPVVRHSITSFTINAPSDRGFLGNSPTDYLIQASAVNSPMYATWTTISSGTTTGTAGEVITGTCAAVVAQFHRVAIQGDGLTYVSIAQAAFNVGQIGELATGGSS